MDAGRARRCSCRWLPHAHRVARLRHCLVCHPVVAPHAVPTAPGLVLSPPSQRLACCSRCSDGEASPAAARQVLTHVIVRVQIAMFVVPVVCLVGWGYGHAFSLDMDPLLIVVLALAVVQTCGSTL